MWDGLGVYCGANGLVLVFLVPVVVVLVLLAVVVVWFVVVVLFVRVVVVLCRTDCTCRCDCVLCRSDISICWILLVWTVQWGCRMHSIGCSALVPILHIRIVVLHLVVVVVFVCVV